MRRNQFTVNAESVQGNPAATVTFRGLTVAEWEEWFNPVSRVTDADILRAHLAGWDGFEDEEGQALPNPPDVAALYLHEVKELCRLLMRGPSETSAKN